MSDPAPACGRQLRPRGPRKSYARLGESGDEADEQEQEQEQPAKRARVSRKGAPPARTTEAPETGDPSCYRSHGLIPFGVIACDVGKFVPDLLSLRDLSSTCREIRDILVRKAVTAPYWTACLRRKDSINQAQASAVFGVSVAALQRECAFEVVRRRNYYHAYYTHFFRPEDVLALALRIGSALVGSGRKRGNAAAVQPAKWGLQALFELRARRARRTEAGHRAARTREFREQHVLATERIVQALDDRLADVEKHLPWCHESLQARVDQVYTLIDSATAHLDANVAREALAMAAPLSTARAVLVGLDRIRAAQISAEGEDSEEWSAAVSACRSVPCLVTGSTPELLARLDELARGATAKREAHTAAALAPTVALLSQLHSEERGLTREERVQRLGDALRAAGLCTDPPRSKLLQGYYRWSFAYGRELCCAEVVAIRLVVDRLAAHDLLRRLPHDIAAQLDARISRHAVKLSRLPESAWRPSPSDLAAQLLHEAAGLATDIIERASEEEDDDDDYSLYGSRRDWRFFR